MKDTYTSFEAENEEDLDRLDKGFTGLMAHYSKLLCIGFVCAAPPFLLWWTKF